MSRNLEARLESSLRELGVREGERLGVACSGGADSVALVHLAHRIRLEPVVLHVDHGLRPNSDADAAFVEDLAGSLGLEHRGMGVRVDPVSSVEAAAREARYDALSHMAAELSLRWVATAHTLDDQAETVLLRAIRGGSLESIAPVRGIFVRPLLDVARDELRSWLSSHELEWREDPTNADRRIERNWLRAEIMPALRERRPGVAKVLARIASSARDDERALDALAAEVLARVPQDGTGILVPAGKLDTIPEAIATRVIRSALRKLGADPHNAELDAVGALSIGSSTRCADVSIWRTHEGLAFVKEPAPLPDPVELPPTGTVDVRAWGVRLRLGPDTSRSWIWRCPVPENDRLILRGRRPGDRVPTRAGTRKVQDVLVDAKVPRPLRDLVPLVATGSGAIAVVGLTSAPRHGSLVIDAEPITSSWSLKAAWSRASS